MEKISIILPVYNGEKFINSCIKSILEQTYKKFELIIINDGSTDNTLRILKSYTDKRIKIYTQNNKGTGAARNLGLQYVSGDYITFVDSDDTININFLKEMCRIIEKYKADIISCECKDKKETPKIQILTKYEGIKYLIALPEKIKMSTTAKLFRKEILNQIWFDEHNHFEDIEFVTKVFLKANRIIYYNKKLYQYNFIKNSRSTFFKNDDRIQACLSSLKEIEKSDSSLIDDYTTYTVFNAIAIANMMIIKKQYNQQLLEKIKKMVRENKGKVKNSNYIFYKKMQIYIFNTNFNFYKFIYRFLNKIIKWKRIMR